MLASKLCMGGWGLGFGGGFILGGSFHIYDTFLKALKTTIGWVHLISFRIALEKGLILKAKPKKKPTKKTNKHLNI